MGGKGWRPGLSKSGGVETKHGVGTQRHPKGTQCPEHSAVLRPRSAQHLLPAHIAVPRCGLEIKAAVRQLPDLAPGSRYPPRAAHGHPRCLSCLRRMGTYTYIQSKCNILPTPAKAGGRRGGRCRAQPQS